MRFLNWPVGMWLFFPAQQSRPPKIVAVGTQNADVAEHEHK